MSDAFALRMQTVLSGPGPLCLGVDPHDGILHAWGLPVSASGVLELGMRAIDAAAGAAGFVKIQVSFFERFGAAGFSALERLLAQSRAAGLVTIADVKRGDIGSTMGAYAAAWLPAGAPLEADAITVHPYLGVESLHDTFRLAGEAGKGVFVLAATSNPEGRALQGAALEGGTVSSAVAHRVAAYASSGGRPDPWSAYGLVIGATVDLADRGLTGVAALPLPILAPGFGHQGAAPEDLPRRFGDARHRVIANESRSLLAAGPAGLRAAVLDRARKYREILDD